MIPDDVQDIIYRRIHELRMQPTLDTKFEKRKVEICLVCQQLRSWLCMDTQGTGIFNFADILTLNHKHGWGRGCKQMYSNHKCDYTHKYTFVTTGGADLKQVEKCMRRDNILDAFIRRPSLHSTIFPIKG